MSEKENRIPEEIEVSEEEARKWDQFELISRPDPNKPFTFHPSEWTRIYGRFKVNFSSDRRGWGSLQDIQVGDIVILKRPGRTDKKLGCVEIDGSEIEFQDLWWRKHKGKDWQGK